METIGIITNSQNAKLKSGMASLEEYLQQLYVENYDNLDQNKSEIEGLMGVSQTYRHYFYSSQEDFSKGTTDYLSDSAGHALYIVRISNLPKDIKEQLVGGTAKGLADKFEQDTSNEENKSNLWKACVEKQDVYGVTSDLKVYYCSGDGDFTGVQADALDMDNPGRTVLSDSEPLTAVLKTQTINFDTDGDGKISAQEARNVKELQLKNEDLNKLSDFSQLYTLSNLTKLYINYNGGTRKEDIDLNGLQNCTKLELVWFYNCTAKDYNYLGKANKLNSLIFYSIGDDDLKRICGTDEKGKGINKYDIKLKYFGVVGDIRHINDLDFISFHSHNSLKSNYVISSLEPLKNLSLVTQKSINYMNIQNNNLSGNLKDISGFTGIKLLRAEYNFLTSLDGLEKANKLNSLCVAYNQLGNIGTPKAPIAESSEADSISLGKDSTGGTSIKALSNNTSVRYACFKGNSCLSNASWILNCTDLERVDDFGTGMADFTGCSQTMIISGFEDKFKDDKIIRKGMISKLGTNLKLPVASYTSESFDITTQKLKSGSKEYSASEVTDEVLLNSSLFENHYITNLNLSGCSKVSQEAWTIFLESFKTQLKYLNLYGCTGLTNLDWICNSDYVSHEAWFSNYYVDVNGVKTYVSLGPTFNVGSASGDNNLTVKGYYFVYDKDSSGSGRKFSTAAGQTIGKIVDNALDMTGIEKPSLVSKGPGEPYFTAYAFEAYKYNEGKTSYQYMVNQYTYTYDSDLTRKISNGKTYNNLNSQKKLIKIDLRGTSVQDYTPLNGLIDVAQKNNKLNISGQTTLDANYLINNGKIYDSYQSSLITLCLDNTNDIKNIIPTVNHLMGEYVMSVERYTGGYFYLSNANLLKKLENLKNLQFLFIPRWDVEMTNNDENSSLNFIFTSLIQSMITGFKGSIYYPNTINKIRSTYFHIPILAKYSDYLTYDCAYNPACTLDSFKIFVKSLNYAPNCHELIIQNQLGLGFSFNDILNENISAVEKIHILEDGQRISSFSSVSNFRNLTNLFFIEIAREKGFKSLDGLEECDRLSEIQVMNCSLSDLGALEKLAQAQITANTSKSDINDQSWLKSLKLNNNQISDIYDLRSLTHLTDLWLTGNVGIDNSFMHNGTRYDTVEFLISLSDACYNTTGQKLNLHLDGTSISDFGQLGEHCNLIK